MIEITDEMVERARERWKAFYWIMPGPEDLRIILQAALASPPPAEPEIVVTE